MKKSTQTKIQQKKTAPVKRKATSKLDHENLFIVGLGASAGGLEALKVFFDHTPSDSGMAFIVVQHLDPTHKSLLTELLRGHTDMNVFEVTDGVKVKRDSVYIIPPNRDLGIFNGSLQLTEPSEKRAERRPIDMFFHSLAKDQKERAVGVVLSGTGTEGTLGLKEIKAEGGIAIVQEPKTAQFTGMPDSAIASKIADYILAPDKIPSQLIQYITKRNASGIKLVPEFTGPLDNHLKKIFMIIRTQTGYDFSNYKTNTIVRRILKRIALNQIDTIENYIAFLQTNPGEVEKLYKDFLIGVTSFFRDEAAFKSIENKAIPWLLQKCEEKQEIRIWVCGCSTGEEAYSFAILFREALEKTRKFIKVIVFASDIDEDAISNARSGIYSDSILPNISAERLARFFIRKDNKYQLKKEIREMMIFAHHNVVKDPPFSKIDLISCRNLLIYMNSDLQKRIIPVFHYSLNNDGILVLGTSESVGDYGDLFADFDSKNKVFKKKRLIHPKKGSVGYELPHSDRAISRHALAENMLIANSPKKLNVSGLIEKYLLDHYTPPSVVIDKNNDILYFTGNTGLYLEPSAGEAKLNVLSMAKKGLKPALEAALKKIKSGSREIVTKGVEVKVNGYFKTISLIVKHVQTTETDLGALMVIFESDDEMEKLNPVQDKKSGDKGKPGSADLERELRITQEHLQSALNDLDISKETLQSTNEEYQSSNEELQSTNEELETSREELQSVNEELITVNNELQEKIEQLSHANDDLNNLLSSIDIATIFLDRDLKIKRFTPTANKIFNLIPSDIDRPVTHLSANIVYSELVDDVKNALKTLAVKSADVESKDGTWFHMRIIPYRTAENVIEGVLVTFVEITELKVVEEKLKKTNEHLNLILENLPAVPFTCEAVPNIKFSFIGKSAEKVTGFSPEQFINNKDFWIKRIHPDDKNKVIAAFAGISKKGSIEHPFRWKCADGHYKLFINFLRYAIAENSRLPYIVGVWQEKNSAKQLKQAK